jgi:hypothetical protein
MNDFGILITIYGVFSVFVLLGSIIIATELLKKTLKLRPSKSTPHQISDEKLTTDETAAVIASIMASNIDNALIETTTKYSYDLKSKTWRNVSKIELMNRRLR